MLCHRFMPDLCKCPCFIHLGSTKEQGAQGLPRDRPPHVSLSLSLSLPPLSHSHTHLRPLSLSSFGGEPCTWFPRSLGPSVLHEHPLGELFLHLHVSVYSRSPPFDPFQLACLVASALLPSLYCYPPSSKSVQGDGSIGLSLPRKKENGPHQSHPLQRARISLLQHSRGKPSINLVRSKEHWLVRAALDVVSRRMATLPYETRRRDARQMD